MTISNKDYKALEDIVGPGYITREPADLDSYCFVWGNELLSGDPEARTASQHDEFRTQLFGNGWYGRAFRERCQQYQH